MARYRFYRLAVLLGVFACGFCIGKLAFIGVGSITPDATHRHLSFGNTEPLFIFLGVSISLVVFALYCAYQKYGEDKVDHR